MKRLMTVWLALVVTASGAAAFAPGDLKKLESTRACVKCNLNDARLSGADLKGVDLRHTKLRDRNDILRNDAPARRIVSYRASLLPVCICSASG